MLRPCEDQSKEFRPLRIAWFCFDYRDNSKDNGGTQKGPHGGRVGPHNRL